MNPIKSVYKSLKKALRIGNRRHGRKWLYERAKPIGGNKQLIVYSAKKKIQAKNDGKRSAPIQPREMRELHHQLHLRKQHDVNQALIRRRNHAKAIKARRMSKRDALLGGKPKPEQTIAKPDHHLEHRQPAAAKHSPHKPDRYWANPNGHATRAHHYSRANMHMNMTYFAPIRAH